MSDHLRYSGLDFEQQREVLVAIMRGQPHLMRILEGMRRLDFPDALLSSGAIYNSVWNVLTGRPPLTGIKDADVGYFDPGDLSYEAEDRFIARAAEEFAGFAIPVEVRNQARVHLWASEKFGIAYPRLNSSAEMLLYFATRTHAVGARMDESRTIAIEAPFGLDDMFSFRLTPGKALDNKVTHEAKAMRAKSIWPELTVVPWDAA